MISVESCEKREAWDEEVLSRGGHPLQLWGWGAVKSAHGWKADRVRVTDNNELLGLAQLLIRPLPWPFRSLVYIPRGPTTGEANRVRVLDSVAAFAKEKYGAVAITIEPDWPEMPEAEGWQRSMNTILIPRTLILDLRLSEKELLKHMAKKTRQYVHKSQKELLTIRHVKSRDELMVCLDIYKQTAERAGFALHDDQYYFDVSDMLGEHSYVMAAFVDGKPVAFLWLAMSQSTAFELYGGMNADGQRLRANYALKWQAISCMKRWGIDRYDFNGLLNDKVSTFKQGFASHEDVLAGTYDKALSPLYQAWSKGLPVAKKLIRTLKRT